MGSEQHYSLRWNDYTVKIVTAFQSLRDEEDFVDVTVACDGHSYSAHKMVLSACSPYFRVLLRANPCQHPIVILKDVGHTEMERLLEFMYNGEVSIAQDQLAAFLKTAESLKIRGLAGNSDDMEQFQRADISYNYNSRCSIGGGGASGRSSPSVSYAPSQASKDDELTTDVPSGYHSRNPDSPPSKRRKRSSAPAASHSDANAASHSTECAVSESGVEVSGSSASDGCGIVGAPSSGPNNDSDDPRLECRELKTEPRDPIIDVYAEGSDLGSDGPQGQQQHQPGGDPLDTRSSVMYPLAMPGPSGTLGGQDTSQEPGGGEVHVKQENDVVTSEWWKQESNDLEQAITQSQDSHRTHYPSANDHDISTSCESSNNRSLPQPDFSSPDITSRDSGDDIHITWQRADEAPLSHLEHLVQTPFSLDDMSNSIGNTNLLVNQRLHLDRPWFSCYQCGKSFKTKVTLSRHERIHTGNAFPCPICPKVFYQVSNVKYHVRSMHGQHYDPGSRVRNSHYRGGGQTWSGANGDKGEQILDTEKK